jgi:transcriptional regulator with XRE-family HTH domain
MQTLHPGLVSIPLSLQQCHELRSRRNSLGISQRELADRVGCSSRTILRLENAQWALSPRMLSTICKELGIRWKVDIKVTLEQANLARRKAAKKLPARKKKRVRR